PLGPTFTVTVLFSATVEESAEVATPRPSVTALTLLVSVLPPPVATNCTAIAGVGLSFTSRSVAVSVANEVPFDATGLPALAVKVLWPLVETGGPAKKVVVAGLVKVVPASGLGTVS